jgi:hypothetical protein
MRLITRTNSSRGWVKELALLAAGVCGEAPKIESEAEEGGKPLKRGEEYSVDDDDPQPSEGGSWL